ncbi:MAG TPA: cardiolipin synthase ClsB [Verrucomicrobiae bacterium]|nr:cardiolipin synthase ClsB [Verrucomicrobiae bacterium]
MTPESWKSGNRVRLLENGEEYYPRVFEAIGEARTELFVETFILFDDPVGRQLQQALIAAARRGVRVDLTVDGYGSYDLSPEFVRAMTEAGVRVHVFDPRRRLMGIRTNIFRRMHRKIVVVDGRIAFVGGINFSFDHLRDHGAEAKQDYAMEVEGPLVDDIRALTERAVAPPERWWRRRRPPPAASSRADAGKAAARFVARDNELRRDEIERCYREAIRGARREIVIANAYFFPGYRLLRDLIDAARRGVDVRLILQGKPDIPWVRWIAQALYDYLLRGGVRIYEYCERPLHAKVATIDDDWSTVGSSNLDPLSLALNLEANVLVHDREFNKVLRARMEQMMRQHCKVLGPEDAPRRTLWRQVLTFVAFHVTRRFPKWAGFLPGHRSQALPVVVPHSANDPVGAIVPKPGPEQPAATTSDRADAQRPAVRNSRASAR